MKKIALLVGFIVVILAAKATMASDEFFVITYDIGTVSCVQEAFSTNGLVTQVYFDTRGEEDLFENPGQVFMEGDRYTLKTTEFCFLVFDCVFCNVVNVDILGKGDSLNLDGDTDW